MSRCSCENDGWSEQAWRIVNRRYEEVEELVCRYNAWEDRQQKNVAAGRKPEYLLKVRAILDTRKEAFISAAEYEDRVGREFRGLGRNFMHIKELVMVWHRKGWSAYLEMGEVPEGDARKELKEFYALSM